MSDTGPEDPFPDEHSLDLPLELTDAFELPDAQFCPSGGVLVMPGAVEIPELGWMPVVTFRFATPDGEFYPPIVLVQNDEQMAKLRPLIVGAVQAARREATIRRAGGTHG